MDNIIEFLERRRFIQDRTSPDLTAFAMKPFKGYLGFDPTADSLHLGNLVGIVALSWLERFGHQAVALIGGATAKVGDPSGKSHERPLLSEEALRHNVKGVEAQLKALLNQPLLLNNEAWFNEFSLLPFLRDVGKHFRVGPMMGKESVRSRLESKEGLSFTEFSYQLLQGYDFYFLHKEHGVEVQIGGSDQWGNITAGIEFSRKMTGKPLYGWTFPLLTRSDGAKFGKSEQGAIWLDPNKTSPFEFYQHLLQVADRDVIQLLQMLTFIPSEEIESYKQELENGTLTPFEAQRRLADEVTRFVHGEEGLKKAHKATEAASFGSKGELDPEQLEEIARDIPSHTLLYHEVIGSKYVDIASKANLTASKGEAMRLIQNQGAYLNNQRMVEKERILRDQDLIGGRFLLLGSGKKKKILINVKKELD